MADLETTIRELATSHMNRWHQLNNITKERDALAESHAELVAALEMLLQAVSANVYNKLARHNADAVLLKAHTLVPK